MKVAAVAFATFFASACADEPDGGADAATDAPAVDAVVSDVAIDAPIDAVPRAAVLVDCASVSGVGGLTAEVTDGMGYVPSITVTIRVGQAARFAYADANTEHTIVSGEPGAPDGVFASPPFTDHGTFTCIRFDAPGQYPIHCDRHPAGLERGVVTVTAR